MSAVEVKPKIVKVAHEGESVDAEEMAFEAVQQPSVFKISDGAVIELRHAIKVVYRLCDKKKPNGDPIYLLMGGIELQQTRPTEKTTEGKQ